MIGFKSFVDARKIPSGTPIEADLCIIGSGPAGISLAREFANTATRIAILETGGLNFEPDIHKLAAIENVGMPYDVDGCRLRYFGGSSNHWGGQCVRLEKIDFEERDWIPLSGWPFGLDHLMPYYDRAHDVHEIGENSYDPKPVLDKLKYQLFPLSGDRIESGIARFNRLRFGIRYAPELDQAANVKIYLYATVTSVRLAPGQRAVSHLTAKTLAGNEITVRAKRFVLATGGIENARLLLDSMEDQPKGLGNYHDLVGRTFGESVSYKSGIILPERMDPLYGIYTDERIYVDSDGDRLRVRGHLAVPMELTRKLRIPKFRAEIEATLVPMHGPFDAGFSLEDVSTLFARGFTKLGRIIRGTAWTPTCYKILNSVEQPPNLESRVTLSDEKNALGQRLAKLDWRVGKLELESIRVAQRQIAHEVGRAGFARFRSFLPAHDEAILDGVVGAMHHRGTTRMHDDPRRGVVDRNCKIHGLENIYVAGSSVFPAFGWANPTLTITALALRLADHLKTEIALNG
jgi:choline dehydrogenase-like flavoprotein